MVPGRLRSGIFLTFGTCEGGRSSAIRTGRLYTRKNPWCSFSGAESVPSGRATEKIDLGTSRLVAQCLNHYTNPGPNATEALHNYPLFQGCTSVGYRRAIKFLVVVPDILGMTTVIFFPYINKSTKPHAPSRKRQITLRFTGHSRTVGPRHEICFVPILWRLEFGGGSPIFGKFVTPDSFNEYVENKLSIIRGIDVKRRAAVLI